MAKLEIKNPRFELISSTLEHFEEVQVIFEYKGKDYKYFIFIEEGQKVDYIKLAKKRFNQDLKNGEVAKTLKFYTIDKKKRFLTIATSALGVAAVAFIALFTYKMLEGGDGPIPSDYVTISFNAGKDNLIENKKYSTLKYYVKKGTTFAEAYKKVKYIGGEKENNDFLYWHLENTNGSVPDDYVIEGDIDLEASYKPVSEDYFTITTRTNNAKIDFIKDSSMRISRDGTNWQNVPQTSFVLEHTGDQVYIKRDDESRISTTAKAVYTCDSPHSISGPIKSFYQNVDSLPSNAFQAFFINDTQLICAKNLDFELGNVELTSYCYASMFSGCTSLTIFPLVLPAATLTSNCYQYMFQNCTSLTQAPALPATTLLNNCYMYMFAGCTSLTAAPELPAQDLTGASNCYSNMFNGCTSLTAAPELPAQDLTGANSCYSNMFNGCISLTQVPSLPATTLASGCYASMFRECTSLTTAPELLATTLISTCYANMFNGCTSLKIGETKEPPIVSNKIFTAPSSPSTYCRNMFIGTSGSFQSTDLTEGMTYYYYE